MQRLSSAWTPGDGDCTTAASTANLGGAAPYWKSWTFDGTGVVASTGNRLTETTHAVTGDTIVTSAYAQPGHAHGVSATTTTIGGTQTGTGSYNYNAAGNTTSRPGADGQQTLSWDAENHLSTVTDNSGTNSYLYNTDGSRLIAHDPTGTTLYVGNAQIRLTTSTGAKTAQRYYSFNGQTVAQYAATGLQFLTGDPHGTSTIAIADTTAQTVTKRYQDPYGNPIGPSAWTGTKTFVGGDQDPTNLIHMGAREYDPALGRFTSADTVIDKSDPQQMNGYAYASNNPVSYSDPTGLMVFRERTGTPKAVAPRVTNVRLKGLLAGIYPRKKARTWTGDGKLGSAVRYEIATGDVVGDENTNSWHYGKAADHFKGLSTLLDDDRKLRFKGKAPLLTERERVIAMDEARELWTALNQEDTSGRFTARVTSTPEGRKLLDEASKGIENGAKNPAVKEFTGTRFQTVRYGGKPIRVEPVSGPRTAGVAGMLSIAGDLLLAYDVGKAVASDNPAEGLRDIACGMGSPVCAGYQGNDAAGNSYFRDNNGEISVVPGA